VGPLHDNLPMLFLPFCKGPRRTQSLVLDYRHFNYKFCDMIEDWQSFLCRLALPRCGRSGPVQARRNIPLISARQSDEVSDKLLRRCLRYRWSSMTTLSTPSPAGCTALRTLSTGGYFPLLDLLPGDLREKN